MNNKNRFINIYLLLFALIICILGCTSQTVTLNPTNIDKIGGVSLVASKIPLTENHIEPIKNIGADYVAIMPFGFIKNLKDPVVYFNSEKQWFGETKEGVEQYVGQLQKKDFKIMLKPQLWVWRGEFTGDIKMDNDEDWILLENSYSKFILEFAVLAEQLHIELFCIGTELEQFTVNRPKYWYELIKEIKKVYQGELTYAANWNEYKEVPFWKSLDYIGIDAYFPLNNNKTPSIEDCKQGWIQYKNDIEKIAKEMDKPIIFTEYGYRSIDFTAKQPWNSERIEGQVNLSGQRNALQALYDEFWNKDWFAGGFIWKWHINHENSGGNTNNRFTPQNKPVEDLMKNYYNLQP